MDTNLFSTPFQIRRANELQGQQQDFALASLPRGRVSVAFASNIGRTIGGGVPRLLGFVPAQERLAKARQEALMSAQQAAGDDPVNFLKEASKRLLSLGDFQGAMSLVDKLQGITANQAKIGLTQSTSELRGAQAENASGQFEHDINVIDAQTDAKKDLQQQNIDAERSMLNQKLGVQTNIKAAELSQANQQFQVEQLQKIRDWRVKADRAESYGQFVDAKENYWLESLKLKAKDLALKKTRNKSLNATDEFRKFQAQAVKDFSQSTAVQAVEKLRDVLPRIAAVSPEKINSMSYEQLRKLLPADVRSEVSNGVNDFISKLDPMKRFMANSLKNIDPSTGKMLPTEAEQDEFVGAQGGVDFDFSDR